MACHVGLLYYHQCAYVSERKQKKPKDPGKGCFSALHTFGRSLFRVVWPAFLSSTYPTYPPPTSPFPPPPFKTVCLSKDRAVSRVQSQGQKFFDYSTCNWYPALSFFSQGRVEKDKSFKKSPKFSLFTAKISKTLSLLLWSIWAIQIPLQWIITISFQILSKRPCIHILGSQSVEIFKSRLSDTFYFATN